MKILITGGKSSQALKLLKAFTAGQVLLADYGDIPSFASANYQFISLGDRNDDTIAHHLLNTCLDQEADCLLPIHAFELEAVVKSAILFEEFNIHVLLPGQAEFSAYPLTQSGGAKDWVVYNRGELIYSSLPVLPADENTSGLNGVFYISETPDGVEYTLFTIS